MLNVSQEKSNDLKIIISNKLKVLEKTSHENI